MDNFDRETLRVLLEAVSDGIGDGLVLQEITRAGQPPVLINREARRLLRLLEPDEDRALAVLGERLGLAGLDGRAASSGPPGVVRRQVELLGRYYDMESREIAVTGGARWRVVSMRDTTKERELDRLKSEFFANTSHELRTPLNAVIGFTELSLDQADGVLPEGHRHNLTRVLVNARTLLDMINDILDLAKLESFKMDVHIEQVDVHRLLGEALDAVRNLVRDKDIKLERVVLGDVDGMYSDQEKLRKVLVNLLSNAVKYTEKGSVKLEAEKVEGGQVEFRVRDTGIGIAGKDLPYIFDRFRQVDGSSTRRVGGAGLGLSLVRELTGLLGGRVAVQSEPSRGSTFTVTFPRTITHAMRRREDPR